MASDPKNINALAKQFQTDKKDVIRYCFSRLDNDRVVHETYIHHLRVIEDSHHQNKRPPQNSNTDHKKARILMLGVKRSGRVRLHKGRQNKDRSIQIGRTWDLDEVKKIEIDPLMDGGFILTMGKPYFWLGTNYQETEMFTLTLLQTYLKYTGGKLPEVVNVPLEKIGIPIRKQSLRGLTGATNTTTNGDQTNLPQRKQSLPTSNADKSSSPFKDRGSNQQQVLPLIPNESSSHSSPERRKDSNLSARDVFISNSSPRKAATAAPLITPQDASRGEPVVPQINMTPSPPNSKDTKEALNRIEFKPHSRRSSAVADEINSPDEVGENLENDDDFNDLYNDYGDEPARANSNTDENRLSRPAQDLANSFKELEFDEENDKYFPDTYDKEALPHENDITDIEWTENDNAKSLELKLLKKIHTIELSKTQFLIDNTGDMTLVNDLIQKSIKQCQFINPLLSFFSMELSAVQDDVEHIEQRAKGIHVETQNKKRLWKEIRTQLDQNSF
ncbi:BA75_04111T0 [Komagataella pastoris]|uniref:BA75_04111T0 n=1 Tax=Komagataella pastoris TaxID=4922 RepID=A0A1B2JF60_PICPA|nr:BA75_04111T0 [Komagataella pastoris]